MAHIGPGADLFLAVDHSQLFAGFEPFQTAQLYVEDTVVDASRHVSGVGIVERTHEDVDGHAPYPQGDYGGFQIVNADGVSPAQLRQFLRDGIPPKGTVLVRWQTIPAVELTLLSNVRLLDRALLTGDVVKRNAKSTVSGTVTKVCMDCVLLHTIYHKVSADHPSIPPAHVVRNVPSRDLMLSARYTDGMAVVYEDWVGRISHIEKEATVRLNNGTVVVVEEPADLETDAGLDDVEVGDTFVTKKGTLRRGRWVFGAFDANAEPVGQVVEMRPTSLEVIWLAAKPGSSKPPPSSILDLDVLQSNAIKAYDFTRPDTGGTTYSSPDYGAGDLVRWRDPAAAKLKYQDLGVLVSVPRTATLGYDINTFNVKATRTQVEVQWQDGSSSIEYTTSIVPDPNIDDDDEVWPGEIVTTREAKAGDKEPWSFTPARVGVVQSVSSADRFARIRWWKHSTVQYFLDTRDSNTDEKFADPGLIPGSTLTNLDPIVEDVSLYDIRPAIGLNKRLGDFCIISEDADLVRPMSQDSDEGVDWFGEVIELGLDGLITLRLGLEDDVRDIKVQPEHLFLVMGSNMPGDFDEGSLADEDADDLEYDDDVDIWGMVRSGETPSVSDWEDEHGSTISAEYYETMEYLGNGGERIEGDGGDDAWSTESEEDDMPGDTDAPMTDAKPLPGPQPSVNDTTTMTEQHSIDKSICLGIAGHPNAPEPFAILEGSAPAGHHYYDTQRSTSNTNLRRISKEHKILRKEGALPEGVFVRTWEARLDLLRVLFIGPLDTPYMLAPFVIDIHLAEDFPKKPPQVFFHSWTTGNGPVNPNLYEDGKVCLSLLGTWSGEPTENWDPDKSTVLQILVSLLGLVLVKEPYFNEAGFDVRIGSEDAKIPSALYSERTYLRSRAFIVHALQHPVDGLAGDIKWLYQSHDGQDSPGLLHRAIDAARAAIDASEGGGKTALDRDGFNVVSAGAVVKLKRLVAELEACMLPRTD